MALAEDVNNFIDPILAAFSDSLRYRLNGFIASAYLTGSAQMVEWGRTKLEKPIFYEGPPMRDAIDYANTKTAKLVKGLDDETREQMQKVIADAVKEKKGVDGLARDLRKQFDDIGKYRSKMVARTETADALEQSFIDRAHDMGITGKEWVTFDPCEVCEPNDGVVVGIDETFPSGHDRPPAHPNCMCALAPVMIE